MITSPEERIADLEFRVTQLESALAESVKLHRKTIDYIGQQRKIPASPWWFPVSLGVMIATLIYVLIKVAGA